MFHTRLLRLCCAGLIAAVLLSLAALFAVRAANRQNAFQNAVFIRHPLERRQAHA